jgi:outer membrane receptor protein involved in Fe transport
MRMAAGMANTQQFYNHGRRFIGEEYRGKVRGIWSHTLSPRTYYEASISWDNWKTFQAHMKWRDTTKIKKIGESWYDETPQNFAESTASGEDQLQMYEMGDGARGADFSDYAMYHFRADITSQVDKYNQAKAGYEFQYAEIQNRVKSTAGGTSWLPAPGTVPGTNWEWWDADPTAMNFYVQDKLEFRGMIANVGVRVEQLDPRHHAYDLQDRYNKNYDYNRFGDSFPVRWPEMATAESKVRWKVSPRIGISHPVTENSKVYFNYGHFYQKPFTRQLFTTQARSAAWGYPIIISNVNVDWPRTVAYELGYDHNLMDILLLHVAGYYKDNTQELGPIDSYSYTNAIRITNYVNAEYSDVRGLEFRVDKRWGRFFTFWANYNYMVRSAGTVGIAVWYEDILKSRDEDRNVSIRAREHRPFATPSARFNLNLHTPYRWGPVIAGMRPLESWSMDVLHIWSGGGKMLFQEAQTIYESNKWLDRVGHQDTRFRVEKRFGQVRSFTVYMMVNNLFNRKELWSVGGTTEDNQLYRQSLKLPWDEWSEKGDDEWMMWDKGYIHLGYQDWRQFLYKRQFYFGVRMNIN